MNKGRRWIENSVYNSRRVIQANSDILWTNKLTGYILDYDEWNSLGSHKYWESSEFYRWHDSRNGERRGTW